MIKYRRYGLFVLLLLLSVVSSVGTATAQSNVRVQEILGRITPQNPVIYFDVIDIQETDTLYVYAESEEIDTRVAICDSDCTEVYVDNDDIDYPDNINSAAEYRVPKGITELAVVVLDCCDDTAEGNFRLLVGVNAPEVVSGVARPLGGDVVNIPSNMPTPEASSSNSGDVSSESNNGGGDSGNNGDLVEVSAPPSDDNPLITGQRQVQELTGFISEDEPTIWFDLFDIPAGQTLFVYAESDEIDTYIVICDIQCEQVYAENDDIDYPSNLNSALEYTIPRDGDYSIAIYDCCSETASGSFRMLLGLNAPDVLVGTALPEGPPIAVLYETDIAVVSSTGGERDEEAVGCSEVQDRPDLSGPELIFESENFVIHYTDQGRDRATDSYVSRVVDAMEEILIIQTQNLGWPLPPPDCGEGGDTRFDVYLLEILDSENILGFAAPGSVIGDNPNSANVEQWASYAYMAIDNDLPVSLMRATAAHEFHHVIQFGYDLGDDVIWFYEATATWMETQTFPEDEDATPYVEALYETTDLCIGSTPSNDNYRLRVYAEWLLIDSIARDLGVDSIERLWETVADFDGMEAFYTFLQQENTTPQAIMMRLGVRNLLNDYALAGRIRDRVRLEGTFGGVGTFTPRRDGVEQLGMDFVRFEGFGSFTFDINQPNLTMYLVGVDGGLGNATVFDLGQRGTVDTTVFTDVYVMILNTDLHDDPDRCRMTDWSLQVSQNTGESLVQALPDFFSAVNFISNSTTVSSSDSDDGK